MCEWTITALPKESSRMNKLILLSRKTILSYNQAKSDLTCELRVVTPWNSPKCKTWVKLFLSSEHCLKPSLPWRKIVVCSVKWGKTFTDSSQGKHSINSINHIHIFEECNDLLSFSHVLFDHQVDPVQRALQVFFSQVSGQGLKVGGAMLVSSECS